MVKRLPLKASTLFYLCDHSHGNTMTGQLRVKPDAISYAIGFTEKLCACFDFINISSAEIHEFHYQFNIRGLVFLLKLQALVCWMPIIHPVHQQVFFMVILGGIRTEVHAQGPFKGREGVAHLLSPARFSQTARGFRPLTFQSKL